MLETTQRFPATSEASTSCARAARGGSGYVELHLIVEASKSVREMHEICDSVERLPGAEVTIHVEPDDGRYTEPRPPPTLAADRL